MKLHAQSKKHALILAKKKLMILAHSVLAVDDPEVAVVPEELDGGRLDEGTRIIHWDLELGPGESKTVQFAFDISHGKDDPVPAFD